MFEVCFESKSPMGKFGNPLHRRLRSRNYFYYIDIITSVFFFLLCCIKFTKYVLSCVCKSKVEKKRF